MTEAQNLSVDVNKAKADELIKIPGIGKSLAQRIIEKRPYHDLHHLIEVPGINEVKLAALKPYITLEKNIKQTSLEESPPDQIKVEEQEPMFGETQTFIFLEDQKDRQDALLIIFGGFILGLIILLMRRKAG